MHGRAPPRLPTSSVLGDRWRARATPPSSTFQTTSINLFFFSTLSAANAFDMFTFLFSPTGSTGKHAYGGPEKGGEGG